MNICPKCREEVYELVCIESGVRMANWDADNGIDIQISEFRPDGIVRELHCPWCNADLNMTDKEAVEFLTGAILGDA